MQQGLCAVAAALVAVWFGGAGVAAQTASSMSEDVRITSAWSQDRGRPGDLVLLAVVLDIKEGLHLNADRRQLNTPADFTPVATELQVISASEGVVTELPRYPEAHAVKFEFVDEPLMVFDHRAVIYLPVQLDRQSAGDRVTLGLQLTYQACGENFCLMPERKPLTVSLPMAPAGQPVAETSRALFADFKQRKGESAAPSVTFDQFGWRFRIDAAGRTGWLLVLLAASLGGLLLNVTPCVLPMVPIKIISLAHAAEQRSRCAVLGVATFSGVLAFWGILGLLVAFVSEFSTANQLFQYPAFTIGVGMIIAVMGLGMFVPRGIGLPQVLYRLNPRQETVAGSFGIGVMTAVLATPCTAPFMGAAAAFAASQSPQATLITFLAIGAGMGMPYLVLSIFPAMVRRVPKTGPASELVKQVMGIFMLAAAAYFIGVGAAVLSAHPPQPPGRWYWWPVMGFAAAAGAWLALRALQTMASKNARGLLAVAGTLMVALSVWGGLRLTAAGPIEWMPYTPESLQVAAEARQAAVVVFTAEWCLNCKALEQNVFANPQIVALLRRPEVVPVKVDLTGHNPAGRAKLIALGRITIPLAVVIAANGEIVFKSDFYTADQLAAAIGEALEKEAPPAK